MLAAIFGFLPAGDPRLRATVLAVADELRHLGNFPQAFSHLALVEAAARLVVAESR